MLCQNHIVNMHNFFKRANLELYIWIAALLLLAFINSNNNHVSLCPLNFLGFHYCPGCGLGRSIALLFRGKFVESFAMHPLGYFAVAMIGYRIVQLTRTTLQKNEEETTEPGNV